MLNSIRKAIALFIQPNTITVPSTQTRLTDAYAPRHIVTQFERATKTPIIGEFHVSDLDTLDSTYLKDAITSLAAWSCLARSFAEYEKVINIRTKDDKQLGKLIDEFHCWNAATSEGKQMDDEAVILAVDKIATVRPIKGNEQTDAIIARVRKCTVKELAENRLAQAAKQSEIRSQLIKGFCSSVWSYTDSDMDPSISNTKIAAKAVQTLEWVANNWTGEPAGIASELLLIENDLKKIEAAARKEEAKDERGFIDGTLTSDYMMKQRA